MSDFMEGIIAKQTPEVQAAIRTLEARGLGFCKDFGYENAVQKLKDMDRAYRKGTLYEWLRDDCGILVSGPIRPRARGRV